MTQFFRTTDHSSDVVGTRQAATFSALTALSGHATVPAPKATSPAKKPKSVTDEGKKKQQMKLGQGTSDTLDETASGAASATGGSAPVGLTVRIEVNLPASGDQ